MIIVTGANGFIGSMIVWELNRKGLGEVAVVDPVPLSEHNLLQHCAYSKFMDKDELWDFLMLPGAASEVSWIIHMGACSSTTETNKEFLLENNTRYTQRLFEWATTHEVPMIYASSAATYGAGELGFDDSIDPERLRPLNLYGESKVLFDRWALKQSQTPPHWYGLKFFNVFGPNEHFKGPMASVVFKAFKQIQETGALKLFKSADPRYKDGEFSRDFVYVKDITEWITELIDKTPASGIYNMGFGKTRTWLDLAHSVFTAMGKEPRIEWIEMPENIREQYQYFTEAKTDKWLAAGMSPARWSLEKATLDYIQNYLAKDPTL